MKNYQRIFLFFAIICISVFINIIILHAGDGTEKKQNDLTQEQAAILASQLANEKFQKDFGLSPFTAESYTAEPVDNKWCWGKISPAGINGCSAKVIFNRDGSDRTVKVAYHTDILKTQKVPIEIKKATPEDFKKTLPGKDRPEEK
jgi:hypothetical protein